MVGTNRDERARLLDVLPVDEQRLDLGGIATAVLEGGDGPPMVLLHGGIQAGGIIWWRVLPALTRTHRVIVPDLPGFGESAPARRLDFPTLRRWLAALIESTSAQPPTLVAHSAPGALAARFATEHGDLLGGLVLVDAAGLAPFRPSPGLLTALVRSSLRPTARSHDRLMARVMHRSDGLRQDAGEDWLAVSRYSVSRARTREVKNAMRQLVRAGTRPIADTELRRITASTVLVWGRHDPMVPWRVAEAASERLGWPLRGIDDAGHLPHVERPDAFRAALATVTGSG